MALGIDELILIVFRGGAEVDFQCSFCQQIGDILSFLTL